MKKLMLLAAAAVMSGLMCPMPARCEKPVTGWSVSNQVTIAAGATNATAEIALNDWGGTESPIIQALVVRNASGTGTGTVTFAAVTAGVSYDIASTNSLLPGTTAAIWPKRFWYSGVYTNSESYPANRLRASVNLSAANTGDCVFVFGACVR